MKLQPEFWTKELELEFQTLALEHYPKEVCAYTLQGQLFVVQNVSENPEEFFELSNEDSIKVAKSDGFIHSHPNAPAILSKADMQSQIAVGIPFGVVAVSEDSVSDSVWIGDFLLDYPIIERPFIHGVLDCYHIVRSIFWQEKGIILPDYAREDEWWYGDENLYLDNFEKAGFTEPQNFDKYEKYDVVLMKVGSQKINHAGVYMGDGKFIHHLANRVSREDNMLPWSKMIEKVVRYNFGSG